MSPLQLSREKELVTFWVEWGRYLLEVVGGERAIEGADDAHHALVHHLHLCLRHS